jgi:hypothetical protein
MQLLYPRPGKLTGAEKQLNIKHNPREEFRKSVYAPIDKEYATRLIIPARAFSRAIADVAIDTPGATRAEMLRLTWVLGENAIDVPVYGIPQLYMSTVRMSDKNKTPDIRTRGILPEWAAYLSVRYHKPQLTLTTIGNMVARAGLIIGVGDDRHQKGGDHGMFEVVGKDHPKFVRLVQQCGRTAQDEALANPVCFDKETEELLAWFELELVNRERKPAKKEEIRTKPRRQAGRNDRYANPLAQA